MAFRPASISHLAKFNSANSSDLLDMYEKYVDARIADKNSEPPSQNFAPSSFRCKRLQWFRIRGVKPDKIKHSDRVLNFTAEVGTACHRVIQKNLSSLLGDNWISVEDFLKANPIPYECILESTDSLETRVQLPELHVRFACDGIIKLNNVFYLLEIKTSELNSFEDLTAPKPEHIDQIKCYSAFLGISDVLFLYQERVYGGLKCYEYHVSEDARKQVLSDMKTVLGLADACIAPEGLAPGDKWCSSNYCPYYQKCKEWG